MRARLLAFAPSLIYVVVAPVSVSLGLWLAFAAAFAIATQVFFKTRNLRRFDGAGLALFGVLALYNAFIEPDSSVAETNLVVECGLLVTALWSMSAGQPFTCQYRLARKLQDPLEFTRVHTLVTAIWTTCFAAMAGLSAAAVVMHRLSSIWADGLGLLLYAATLTFTWQVGAYIDKHEGKFPVLGKW